MSKKDRDAVGYRRPPTHSQFKPGVSGNPNGRPKNSFKSDMLVELSELTTFQDGDTSEQITKQRAIAKRLVRSALIGDARAMNLLMSFLMKGSTSSDEDDEMSPEDHELLMKHGERAKDHPDAGVVGVKANEGGQSDA